MLTGLFVQADSCNVSALIIFLVRRTWVFLASSNIITQQKAFKLFKSHVLIFEILQSKRLLFYGLAIPLAFGFKEQSAFYRSSAVY